MSGWVHLNPFRSLYGRIFLWFWLTTIVMIAGSAWVVHSLMSGSKYQPISETQQGELYRARDAILRSNGRPERGPLSERLRRFGQREQMTVILLDLQNNELIISGPMRKLRDEKPFLDLISSTNPLRIVTPFGEFSGPLTLKLKQKDYLMFVGDARPIGFPERLREGPPLILIGLMLLISAGLCSLIARSLVKPIKQLQAATKSMADGELSTRVGSASYRSDEIGQLGLDFNHMAEQIETLLNGQKRLLGDISHELRTPLTRMQLAIGIAQQQESQCGAGNSELALTRIEKEAHQMEHMVAQVLMLSRLDSNVRVSQKQEMSFDTLLTGLLADCEFEAQSHNKTLSVVIDSDANIYADGDLLTSGIENVLRNAVKYANEKVVFELKIEENMAQIKICDDGIGIPESDLSHIFQPFYRVSCARDRDTGGVGLGLAIASRAIAVHQGEIVAHNQVKGGLCVHISLPTVS
ncbi:ATP-binding protein [Paraglaciecola polaris]|uniref:histidine kinase n=1 Tax=Paraglaciecola polaris LMG 21857 TaxID=1129793 RepID=K7AAX5_9ALTE|nr:ATP-binding protein [Paraglaciecola polaris]GAC32540.1 two-component system, OmpR family, sensor histidine kinase CpxA [Paraglaciecola polaris LMG 21857]|tara:strand:+ start:2718 stop:4118 length:1401 start_codon:yes stop_codon:yes gene_type:complete